MKGWEKKKKSKKRKGLPLGEQPTRGRSTWNVTLAEILKGQARDTEVGKKGKDPPAN